MSEQAEHQRDLDELARTKNARGQLDRDLAAERREHTSLKQLIREYLGSTDQEGEPESVLVMEAGARLAELARERPPTVNALPVPMALPVRDGDDEDPAVDPEEPDDGHSDAWFRDHAFLQSLAGSAVVVAAGAAEAPDIIDAADFLAERSVERRNW